MTAEHIPSSDYTLDDALAEQMLLRAVLHDLPSASERATTSDGVACVRLRDDLADGNPTRWHDPATSHAAGASVNLCESEHYTLGLLAEIGPSTDERLTEIAAARKVKWTAQRLRSARAALVLAGRVVRVLPDGKTATGRAARRWRAVS